MVIPITAGKGQKKENSTIPEEKMQTNMALPPTTMTEAFHRCWAIAKFQPGYNKQEWIKQFETFQSAFPLLRTPK